MVLRCDPRRDDLEAAMTSIAREMTPDGREAWFARRHAHVKDLMNEDRLTMQPPGLQAGGHQSGAWLADSPFHRILLRLADQGIPDADSDRADRTRRRHTMSTVFRPSNLHRNMADVKGYAEALLDEMIAAGPPADLSDRFSQPLCAKVVCELLGLPDADVPRARKWIEDKDASEFRVSAMALRHLSNYVRDLLERRRQEPGDDVVSALIAAGDPDDKMHMARMANVIVFILGLGIQLSTAAIDYGTVLLLTHPEQMRELQEDPSLIKLASEEVLRHFNGANREIGGVDRFADEDFEYGGAQIRKGDMIVMDVAAANHDPDVFSDPHGFDIRRNPNPHLAFGSGFYYCNFAQMARHEVVLGLEAILRRLPTLRLAQPPESLEYRRFPATGPVAVPVTW
jgi:pentalenolactone synthase